MINPQFTSPPPTTCAILHDTTHDTALCDSPFAAAGADLALEIKKTHVDHHPRDLTPRALYTKNKWEEKEGQEENKYSDFQTSALRQWVAKEQLLQAHAANKALQAELEKLQRIHAIALEELGAQQDRVAELEGDMQCARDVLAQQATMLVNIDSRVQQRIAAALQPVVDARFEIVDEEDEDGHLQEQLHVMVCSSDSTSFLLY